jgi:hypothetical protein
MGTRFGRIAAIGVACCCTSTAAYAQQQQDPTKLQPVSRPFPIVQYQFGDVPLALPQDWVETKFVSIGAGSRPFITFANVNLRQPPRSTHFDVPPLRSFVMVGVPRELVERNLREQKIALEQRWSDRVGDNDGFWRWKTGEYVLVGSSYPRPLDQPLFVKCTGSLRQDRKPHNRPTDGFKRAADEQRCGVSFYWTLNAGVRYDFYDTDFPKSRWTELDQQVLALLDFLDGRKVWLGGK